MAKPFLTIEELDTLVYLRQEGFDSFADILELLVETNPYPRHSFRSRLYLEQVLANIPLLYFASIYLFSYAQKIGVKHFLFTQRDCIHWHRIFQTLFPSASLTYFGCSRNMFQEARRTHNQEYWQYVVKQLHGHTLEETIYVDIFGSGRNAYEYMKQECKNNFVGPHLFLLTNRFAILPEFAQRLTPHLYHVVSPHSKSVYVEMFNFDLVGSIANYSGGQLVRLPLEYDTHYVKIYHDAVNRFITLISKLKVRLDSSISEKMDLASYQRHIRHFLKFVQKRPIIAQKIPFIKHHPKVLLESVPLDASLLDPTDATNKERFEPGQDKDTSSQRSWEGKGNKKQ